MSLPPPHHQSRRPDQPAQPAKRAAPATLVHECLRERTGAGSGCGRLGAATGVRSVKPADPSRRDGVRRDRSGLAYLHGCLQPAHRSGPCIRARAGTISNDGRLTLRRIAPPKSLAGPALDDRYAVSGRRRRLSRVPWNFGGGPMFIRLRSRFHHGGRHRQSARRHGVRVRLVTLAGAGGR